MSAILQTQALYVGKALLAAQSATNLKMLASDVSPGIHFYTRYNHLFYKLIQLKFETNVIILW